MEDQALMEDLVKVGRRIVAQHQLFKECGMEDHAEGCWAGAHFLFKTLLENWDWSMEDIDKYITEPALTQKQ